MRLVALLIGHLADTHVGANHFGVPDYPEDTLEAFREAIELLMGERPDAIVIAGDLFDRPRPENRLVIEVARILRWTARDRGIPVILAVGEHDQPPRRDSPSVSLVAEAAGDGVYAPTPGQAESPVDVMRGMTVKAGRGHVIVLPFMRGSPERRRRAAKTLLEASGAVARLLGGKVVLAAHIGLTTATVPDDAVAEPAHLPPVDYAALGHVHKPFLDPGGGGVPPHAYPGTLVPIRVDEVSFEERGPLLVDISGPEASISRLKVEQPRSHVVAKLRVRSVRAALEELASILRGVPRRRKPTIAHLYLTIPADPALSKAPVAREIALRASEALGVVARVVRVYRERPRYAVQHAGAAGEVEIAEGILGDRDLAELLVKLKEAILAGDREEAGEIIGEMLSPRFDGAWARILGSRPERQSSLGGWMK